MKKISMVLSMAALVTALTVTGCSSGTTSVVNPDVTVTPSDLFKGDSRVLEAHLGLTTGCVDVKYGGNKEVLTIECETWEDGEVVEHREVLNYFIEDGFDGEISFSVKELIDDEYKKLDTVILNSVISEGSGYAKSSVYEYGVPDGMGHGAANLREVIETTDDESVIVWGIGASNNGYSSYTDISRTFEEADWALVMKVSFRDDLEY